MALALSLVSLLVAAAPIRRPAGDVGGVHVEQRDVDGSAYPEFRATTDSGDSLVSLCDAVFGRGKGESASGQARFKHRELIRETPSERWTYEQIGVPIVADRDYVMHVKLLAPASTGRCEIAFETEDLPAFPPRPGLVRIPLIRGSWLLEPESFCKVRVRYQVYSDPGGGLPAFLVKGAQRDAAVSFLRAILSRAAGR